MAPRRKLVTCFTLDRRNDHGYWHLYMRVFQARPDLVKDRLEDAIDNKAGYGSPEAAKRMERWFKHLLAEGHRIRLETDPYEASFPSTILEWMEITADPAWSGSRWSYSEGTIDSLGNDKFSDIQRGAKFLRKLARKIAITSALEEGRSKDDVRDLGDWILSDPTLIIETLEAMKAKRVEVIRGTGVFEYMNAWVPAQSPRPYLISDTLYRSFEMRS